MSNITEEIKSRLDIVEVLSEYIELKKAGANFKACCPFHQEKTASFVVSPERQIWHCFGCGAGSDIFGFVMKIEGIEFPEALRILAKKANVNLTNQNFNLTSARTNLLDITRLAAMFYQQNLLDSTAGQTARDYLKKRQVSDEIIKRFQLGYALDSWDNLLKFLIKKGISEKDIALAGLIIKKTTSNASTSDYYDRFRGRLMFPIADAYGNAVGFTGRVLPSEETNAKKETAKYVNTPETSIYHKGRILYGLDQAKETIRKNNYVIIVEGNMDVLASHQAGIHNVVASSGTALTMEQINLLKRYTKNLILSFDVDLAGQTATRRGIDIALQAGTNVKIITLLAGKDPDDCVRIDPELWHQSIKKSKPLMEYYFDFIFNNLSTDRIFEQKKVEENIFSLLSQFNSKIEQDYWLKKMSERMNISEQALLDDFQQFLFSLKQPNNREIDEQTDNNQVIKKSRIEMAGEELIGFLLKYPAQIDKWLSQISPDLFSGRLSGLVKEIKLYYDKSNSFNYRQFYQKIKLTHSSFAEYSDVLTLWIENNFFDLTPAEIDKAIKQSWLFLKEQNIITQSKNIALKIKIAEQETNQKKIEQLSKQFNELTEELKNINQNN